MCPLLLDISPLVPFALLGLAALEVKRDALAIENEEQVTLYYRIRQQLLKLEAEMQVMN